MKKRFLPVILASTLTISCLSFSALAEEAPVLGAEGTTFVDISPEDWFAPYVKVCVEEGLMKGVGNGRFDPQGTVTMAEAATLAARIHHLKNGGDGNLPHAPEEWGRMTLTFEDGESFPCYHSYYDYILQERGEPRTDGWHVGGRTGGLLYFSRLEGWDGRDYQRVTLEGWTSETPIQGRAEVINNVGTSLHFIPDPGQEGFYELLRTPETSPSYWYRDTDYYILTQELDFYCAPHSAQRQELVEALDKVVGELAAINHITDYPDSDEYDRDMVLRFYNGGILTGTDALGSFTPNGYLTRAEMAAMAARILRPELRVEFSLQEPEFQSYTLTPLGLASPDISREFLSTDLMRFYRYDQEGNWIGESVLRADGTVLDLPEGSYISQFTSPYFMDEPYPLLLLSREDMTMPAGFSYGVMDPLTGEMVLPFGPYAGNGAYPGAGNCAITKDGRMILTKEATWDRETWTPTLLWDDKGNVLRELPETETLRPYEWGALGEVWLIPNYDPDTGLYGYRDMDGEWVIPPQYTSASSFVGSYFVGHRAIVSRDTGYGVINSLGREVIPFVYDQLEFRGKGLYRSGWYGSDSYWVREDGTTFQNGYLRYDIYLCNGYFDLYNRYLDENFQYATPAVFDWTGPINAQGSGFVGMDGQVYRIQFEAVSPETEQ